MFGENFVRRGCRGGRDHAITGMAPCRDCGRVSGGGALGIFWLGLFARILLDGGSGLIAEFLRGAQLDEGATEVSGEAAFVLMDQFDGVGGAVERKH